MPEIKHVLLDYSEHFLVVDGTRGPVSYTSKTPAIHPAGYGRFRSDAYDVPEALKGKLFRVLADAVPEESADTCEPAKKALTEYMEIAQTCKEVQKRRYEEAAA